MRIKCPYCGSIAHKHGKTNNGKQRYKCSDWPRCDKTFTEVGGKEVFIIKCPECGKETMGRKYGKVYYTRGKNKQRYRCSECGTKTVKIVRKEYREKIE